MKILKCRYRSTLMGKHLNDYEGWCDKSEIGLKGGHRNLVEKSMKTKK
jgi:hypothetical protein